MKTEQLKVPLSLVSITIVFFSFVVRAVIRVNIFYGKMHYRLDGWKKGPWVFENLDSISENRLSVPEMMFEIFSVVLLLNKESSV